LLLHSSYLPLGVPNGLVIHHAQGLTAPMSTKRHSLFWRHHRVAITEMDMHLTVDTGAYSACPLLADEPASGTTARWPLSCKPRSWLPPPTASAPHSAYYSSPLSMSTIAAGCRHDRTTALHDTASDNFTVKLHLAYLNSITSLTAGVCGMTRADTLSALILVLVVA
jgi:hypothetical protein